MNSVDRYLGADTKAATLLAMRSAKKDAILVVEGDTDVDLFANTLSVPRSNILSCGGKEILMLVYEMAPAKGIDPGTIFIRDRDHDSAITGVRNGVLILVTTLYDVEMEMLANRIFGRILRDYLKEDLDEILVRREFQKLCLASGYIGALRLYSHQNSTGINFDDIKYNRFLDHKTLSVKLSDMVRYMFAKSQKTLDNSEVVENDIGNTIASRQVECISCSKEFVDIFSLALSRHYNACPAAECSSDVINRTVRVAATKDDIMMMPIYEDLKRHITTSGISWNGTPL